MSDKEKKDEISQAVFELQCTSEIMGAMGKPSEDPGAWIDCLGEQVCRMA
jgi:hypothetical protein